MTGIGQVKGDDRIGTSVRRVQAAAVTGELKRGGRVAVRKRLVGRQLAADNARPDAWPVHRGELPA
jgi:hypothetical protein